MFVLPDAEIVRGVDEDGRVVVLVLHPHHNLRLAPPRRHAAVRRVHYEFMKHLYVLDFFPVYVLL